MKKLAKKIAAKVAHPLKKLTQSVLRSAKTSIRQFFHTLILAGTFTDEEIHAACSQAAGKLLPKSYVSWYRCELRRLGVTGVPARLKVAVAA